MRRFLWIVVVAILLVAPVIASAQPLTDRVPADALIYFGWKGADTLGKTYDDSHLAAVIKASNFQDLIDKTLPQLIAKIPQDKPEVAANLQAVVPLIKHAWHRPVAMFVAGGADARGRWQPRFGLMIDAGEKAAEFQKSLDALVTQMDDKKMPARTAIDGQVVIFTIGYPDALAASKPATALKTAAGFTSALKQVDADPVMTVYVDGEQIVHSVDAAVVRGNDKRTKSEWPQVRDALGLASLKRYISTGAFDGKDWSSRCFIDCPEPRKGLATMLSDQAISDAMYKLVPVTASYAMVHQIDPAKIFHAIHDAVIVTGPKSDQEFQKGMENFHKMFGVDALNLIEPWGDQFAIYTDKGVAGAGAQGLVVASPLDDAKTLDASLDAFLKKIGRLAAQNPNPAYRFQTTDTQIGNDITVHTIQVPQGQPSWTIKDGVFFFGVTPKGVGAATLVSAQPSAAAGGFSKNEKFAAVRARITAPEHITGFEFADLPQTVDLQYQTVAMAMGMVNMMLFAQGVQIPANMLPPADVLKQQLAPAGGVSYVDAAGWRSRNISPFPGSYLFASQQVDTVGVGGVALMTSILLPSLNRARETANRVKCASNERQIGQAILLYANDNKGKYPPDLGELLKTQDITLEVFTCPSSDNDIPDEVANAAMDMKVAWLNANSSYTYVGAGMRNTAGAEAVVLFERKDDHDEAGMNFLFGDGHVEWLQMDEANKLIEKAGAAGKK